MPGPGCLPDVKKPSPQSAPTSDPPADAAKGQRRPSSRFVPFPQEIWEKGIDLRLGAFRLLGYLLYLVHSGLPSIELTDEELLHGRWRVDGRRPYWERARDGNRADSGSGIKGRNNLKAAREQLAALGWLEVSEPSWFGRRYRLLLDSDSVVSDERSRAFLYVRAEK